MRGVWEVFIIAMLYRNSNNANRVDPDQTPHSVAFELDLHCLAMSLLWDSKLKWVKFCYTEKGFEHP